LTLLFLRNRIKGPLMSSYLVTGGAGFVGSNLVDALLGQGHRVRVFDDLSSGYRANVSLKAEFMEGDVTDPAGIAGAFDGIDGCFHLAAIASVVRSNEEWLRTHQVNLTGAINVLDQARRLRPGKGIPVVYASTAAVYGDSGNRPVTEQHVTAPLSAYGADKRACELHASVAGTVHGVPTIALRFFNLYGPRQDRRSPYSGVIANFADRFANAEPVKIFGDGEQVRDFTYVGDAVSALCRALPVASIRAPVFNVCTGRGTTIRGLAETMAALYRIELLIDQRPARLGEVCVSIGDPHHAAERLGFRAETKLAEGLSMMLNLPLGSLGCKPRAVA
jgi:UDP-glucose 4-epimerase